MSTVYIGIGSNLGEREENCLHAIELLTHEGIVVKRRSLMYETEPWGVKDQPRFINMVVEIETEIGPQRLLQILKTIEQRLGRVDISRWGPRCIDLDIIFYDDIVLMDEGIQIPHPMMHQREFVLRPLSEIAAEQMHPLLKRSVKDLLAEIVSP